jgi:hypothetical protein
MIYTTQSVVVAQELLGKDFIHPADLRHSFKKIPYTTDQILNFLTSIPPEEILVWGRDNNCMLVPGPAKPLSLLGLREQKRSNFQEQYGGVHFQQDYAEHETVGPGWIMLRKELTSDSVFATPGHKAAMMSQVERIPKAAEIAWCLCTYKAVRGIPLLRKGYALTSSYVRNTRVAIGEFTQQGIKMCYEHTHPRAGLLTAHELY